MMATPANQAVLAEASWMEYSSSNSMTRTACCTIHNSTAPFRRPLGACGLALTQHPNSLVPLHDTIFVSKGMPPQFLVPAGLYHLKQPISGEGEGGVHSEQAYTFIRSHGDEKFSKKNGVCHHTLHLESTFKPFSWFERGKKKSMYFFLRLKTMSQRLFGIWRRFL